MDNADLTGTLIIDTDRATEAGGDRGDVSGVYTKSAMSYHGAATVSNPMLKLARHHEIPFPDSLFGTPLTAGAGFARASAAVPGGSMAYVDAEIAADITSGSFVNPLSVAGCWAWWQLGTGLTDSPGGSGNITTWNDQSGNGRYMSNGFFATPQLQFDGTILFNGSTQLLGTFYSVSQPFTVVARYKPISVAQFTCVWGDDTNNVYAMYGSGAAALQLRANSGATFVADNTDAVATGSYITVVTHFEDASSFIQVDGGTKTTGTAGTNNSSGFYFGCAPAQGGFSNIRLAEVAMYQGRTAGAGLDADLADLVTYMAGVI